MGVTNKSADFLAKFPLGKVPAMETPEGPLTESEAIAYYVASSVKDSPLLGKTHYERALIQKYVLFGALEMQANIGAWLYPLMGYYPYNKDNEKNAQEKLLRALKALDTELLSKTFLVGERVTLADISVACTLLNGYKFLFDEKYRTTVPNVTRWFLTAVNQPNFKAVLGEVVLCQTAMVYDAKKINAAKQPKTEAAAPKAKKEAPKPAADDAEDDLVPREEKKKSVLDSLPPSAFNVDAWKRFYSNNDTRPTAIDYFWQNFDPQGWSLWKVDYKYNEELGAIFMSSNLIGGFFQRLERARKYAFGSLIITGEANNSKISGYFVIRGQEVPEEVYECPDYDSYTFTKVDSADPKVRESYNDYIAWEGPTLPGKFADGKIFK
jgi:elongation factor 1-gamma